MLVLLQLLLLLLFKPGVAGYEQLERTERGGERCRWGSTDAGVPIDWPSLLLKSEAIVLS